MDAHPDMPPLRSSFFLLAFLSWLLLAVPPSLGQQQSGQTTRFLTRIGATAELDVGYSARFNGYNTYGALLQTQIPVEYDTKVLSVLERGGNGPLGQRLQQARLDHQALSATLRAVLMDLPN
jgi:hypothetical protein